MATWYKKKIKDSILEQVYADKNKTAGVQYTSTVIPESSTVIPAKAGIQNKNDVEAIYQRYLQAFKKGVYNYIKEEIDPATQETIPRKYFSGGEELINVDAAMSFTTRIPSDLVADKAILSVNIEGADQAMKSRGRPESKGGKALRAGQRRIAGRKWQRHRLFWLSGLG